MEDNIDERIDRIKTALRTEMPFLASLLNKSRIYKSKGIPAPAMTSPNSWIYVNPILFEGLKFEEQAFIIAHEVLHVANLHSQRGTAQEREGKMWNYATDSVVNNILSNMLPTPRSALMPRDIEKELKGKYEKKEIEKADDIKLYKILLEEMEKQEGGGEGKGEGDDSEKKSDSSKGEGDDEEKEGEGQGEGDKEEGGSSLPNSDFDEEKDPTRGENGEGDLLDREPGESEGVSEGSSSDGEGGQEQSEMEEPELVQEGDADFNDAPPEVKQREWKKAISDAAMMQKEAGDMPAGLERYVDEILKPDLDVKSLINEHLKKGVDSLVISNWRRPSRKHRSFPGKKMLTVPTIWCLIDTSGSIRDDELKSFLGAVYEFTSRADVKVIPWDAKEYQEIEAKTRSQVMSRVAKRLQGGGGTVIKPPMTAVLNKMDARDIVCVMTDGEIQDIDKKETISVMRKVKSKASSAFICTTRRGVSPDEWKVIEMVVP